MYPKMQLSNRAIKRIATKMAFDSPEDFENDLYSNESDPENQAADAIFSSALDQYSYDMKKGSPNGDLSDYVKEKFEAAKTVPDKSFRQLLTDRTWDLITQRLNDYVGFSVKSSSEDEDLAREIFREAWESYDQDHEANQLAGDMEYYVEQAVYGYDPNGRLPSEVQRLLDEMTAEAM